jgi:hypothetical protein
VRLQVLAFLSEELPTTMVQDAFKGAPACCAVSHPTELTADEAKMKEAGAGMTDWNLPKTKTVHRHLLY